ncbi:uncharacterized protein [Apostichopus japonicus]|uniref:uncharacterized protein isoform X2 n=1 Tax=Stichopus japonicus TaxID=307972 RepID=UPI003AB71207
MTLDRTITLQNWYPSALLLIGCLIMPSVVCTICSECLELDHQVVSACPCGHVNHDKWNALDEIQLKVTSLTKKKGELHSEMSGISRAFNT